METAMGIIKTLDESVTNGMSNSLIAMTFLEVKAGAGKGVFHMMHDAG